MSVNIPHPETKKLKSNKHFVGNQPKTHPSEIGLGLVKAAGVWLFSLFILYCFDLHSESQGLCFHQHLESIVSPLSWLRFLSRADPGARPWMGVLALGGDPRIRRRGSEPPSVHQWVCLPSWAGGESPATDPQNCPLSRPALVSSTPNSVVEEGTPVPFLLTTSDLLIASWTCRVWGPSLLLRGPKNTSGDKTKESIL